MKKSAFVAALLSCAAFAAKPDYDAFVQSPASRSLKDARTMSKQGQQTLEQSRVSSVERRYGVPTFTWGAAPLKAGQLRDAKVTAEQAARRYLFQYGELYRVAGADLAEAKLKNLHDLGQGAIIATFTKDFDGVRVFRDEIKVVMNQQLDLVAVSGYLSPARKKTGEFRLAGTTAIVSAFADMTGKVIETNTLKPLSRDEAGFDRFMLSEQPTPVRVRQTYYAMPEGLVPSFHVELEVGELDTTEAMYFSYVISAIDGSVLSRKNLTQSDSFSYRVWAQNTGPRLPDDGPNGLGPTPHPTGLPDSYNPPFVMPTLVSLQNGPISTNDPWLAAGATETRGNNCDAYADSSSPNGFSSGDLRASTTAPGVFDRVYDTAAQPNASPDQQMAAVTQLFYNVNLLHDWFYDVGFDEKSGNAQTDNLGRGGAGNDALLAEAQDYSGTDNANMSTPSDGARPRMQMYVFTAGGGAKVTVTGTMTIYQAGIAQFGPQGFTTTGDVVQVDDGMVGTGQGASNRDGCEATNWVTPVTGKIALVDRGLCTFSQKAANAQANGAIALIIANNTGGGAPYLSGSGNVTIPTLSISRTSGTALKNLIAAGTVNLTLERALVTDRDGTIDNQIVAHEWGHYISNRLIGDGNGIANNQAGGMGEGWGDFTSMLISVREGDDDTTLHPANPDWTGVYGMAGYTTAASDPNGYYYGIRRLPYSTNMMKNPLTFKHISDGIALPAGVSYAFGQSGQSNAEVHNTGEVWATMLWECWASLLRDRNRYTFTQATDKMRAYLVASYKATPLVPTFVDARDAVLAAAAAGDMTDFALFSAAFAKRGIGMKAVAPDKDSQTNSPVVESFVTGNDVEIVKVTLDDSVQSCDQDGQLDNGEKGKVTVTIKNIGVGALMQTTATLTAPAESGLTFANNGAITFSPLQPFQSTTASVEVSLAGLTATVGAVIDVSVADPSLTSAMAVKGKGQFRLNFDAKPSGAKVDDVEAPTSEWAFTNNPQLNTGADWRRYEDTATAHWYFGPDSDSPADTFMTSPALTVSATEPLVMTFMHRFEFEGDASDWFDGGVVEIQVDNGMWTDIGTKLAPTYSGTLSADGSNPLRGRQAFVGKSAGYPAFAKITASLGTEYAGKTVKIRFRIGADDAVGLKGWEIDDIGFTGITNSPFATVVKDPNTCSANTAPVVTAAAQTVQEGMTHTFVVSSTDAEGDTVTYVFTQTAGTPVTITGNTFVAPQVGPSGEVLSFSVVGNDGKVDSAAVAFDVTVTNGPGAPDAMPQTLTVNEGEKLTITGSAVDPEGDAIVSWAWVQLSGPAGQLDSTSAQTINFTAPQVDGDQVVVLQLTAGDASGTGAPANVTITIKDTSGQPTAKNCGCGSTSGNQASLAMFAMAMVALLMRRRRQ